MARLQSFPDRFHGHLGFFVWKGGIQEEGDKGQVLITNGHFGTFSLNFLLTKLVFKRSMQGMVSRIFFEGLFGNMAKTQGLIC